MRTQLTGVFAFVYDEPFDSGVFDGCLRAAGLYGCCKVFVNTMAYYDMSFWDELMVAYSQKRTVMYLVTVAGESGDLSVSDMHGKWDTFMDRVFDSLPVTTISVRALDIR